MMKLALKTNRYIPVFKNFSVTEMREYHESSFIFYEVCEISFHIAQVFRIKGFKQKYLNMTAISYKRIYLHVLL